MSTSLVRLLISLNLANARHPKYERLPKQCKNINCCFVLRKGIHLNLKFNDVLKLWWGFSTFVCFYGSFIYIYILEHNKNTNRVAKYKH